MRERTLTFGAGGRLVGTLTVPDGWDASPQRFTALLSNSGVIPRAGWGRVNVRIARRFAALGIASMRFDMSGLGDSAGADSGLSAARQWVEDTRAAMDAAAETLGSRRFLMVGLCSGADIAYLTALDDARLEAAVLWDLCCYPTRKARLRAHLLRIRSIGLPSVLRLPGAILSRARRLVSPAGTATSEGSEGFYGRTEMPSREEFVPQIARLVERRVALLFGYSGSAPSWFNYRAQFSDMFADSGWLDRVSWEYLADCDHLHTQRRSQQLFGDWVESWVRSRVLKNE